jgi:hypothetical protein
MSARASRLPVSPDAELGSPSRRCSPGHVLRQSKGHTGGCRPIGGRAARRALGCGASRLSLHSLSLLK